MVEIREDNYIDEDNDWEVTEFSKQKLGFDFSKTLSKEEEEEIKQLTKE